METGPTISHNRVDAQWSPECSAKGLQGIRPADQGNVPPETIDHIIDFLHDDKFALRQCSLVCRSWLPTSSLHLFHSLSWPPCYHAGWGWERKKCKCRTLDQSSFLRILCEFCEGCPRVQAHVRVLKIACHWIVVDSEWGRTDYNVRISLREMQGLLDLLPSLRELSLEYLSLRSPRETLRPRSPRRLAKLTLTQPSPATAPVSDVNSLLDFLCLFDHISTLVLNELRDGLDFGNPLQPRDRRIHIDNLIMPRSADLMIAQYLQLLRIGVDIEHITAFSSHAFWPRLQSSGEFHMFLRTARSLRSLVIRAMHPPLSLGEPSQYASLCPSLRELVVHASHCYDWGVLPARAGDDVPVRLWSDILKFLLNRPFPSVCEIEVVFSIKAWPAVALGSATIHGLRGLLDSLEWSFLDSLVQAYSGIKLILEVSGNFWLPEENRGWCKLAEEVVQNKLSVGVRKALRLIVR